LPAALETEALQLKFSDKDRKVIITMENEDRFSMTVQEAALACKLADNRQLFKFRSQFKNLLNELAVWIQKNRKKVFKAFMTVRDAGLLFLIVRNEVPFDRDFEDQLSDLDIAIAQNENYSLINLSVLALPRCSPSAGFSFLSLKNTLAF